MTFLAAFAALVLAPLRLLQGARARRIGLAGLAALLAGAAAAARFAGVGAPPPVRERFAAQRPVEVAEEGYVGSDACASCHPHQADTWRDSYHRTMTQVATPESVVGDFDDVELRFLGETLRLFRRGDEFWVDMPDPQAPRQGGGRPRVQRPVVLTTGSHHQQVYWVPGAKPRDLKMVPLVYLIEDGRWAPRIAKFLTPPRASLPFEPVRWNEACIQCHAVHGRPRPRQGAAGFDTRVAELGIACEGCHGPAAEHVRANRDPQRRYAHYLDRDDPPDPSIVHPARLPALRSAQVCGQCHGLNQSFEHPDPRFHDWLERGFDYRPGQDLHAARATLHPSQIHRVPAWQEGLASDPDFFQQFLWRDGVVRIRGREYNALIDSPCFAGGEFSCRSCHSMHQAEDDPRPRAQWANGQLAPGMDGDAACLQCHESFAGESALEAHSQHVPESPGSRCQNCHMPYSAYGLLKSTRSHQVSVPSARESVEAGRPNACSLCHLDRPLAWAARELRERHGLPEPALDDEQRRIAAGVLWTLTGDAGQRALMAWAMGWEPARQASGEGWLAPYLATLLTDPYDAVRYIAGRSLARLPGFSDLAYDFYAAPAARRATAQRAIAHWNRLHPPGRRPVGDAILIGDDGAVRRRAFNQLARRRDDRDLTLAE